MGSQDKDVFRDSIGTINESGGRQYIFPKQPKGKYYQYRTYLSYLLIAFLFAAPFVKINGNQFLLFNILDRKFNIFSLPFWPQDFYLLVMGLLASIVFIILFTTVFGRVFCGWVCPQTIFMEMVFRKIEYFIEGDRNKQIKLSKQEWDGEKIRKRLTKWSVFFLVSFLIANVFLAYLIGSDVLIEEILEGPQAHLSTFLNLVGFTCVFYFVFAWFREQVCVVVCPYGRLQGVLLDEKSINVAYDFKRGEGSTGRAKMNKKENRQEQGHGDCIDCKACVHVCPTGIDIRNGTQMECVNCTACMDSCDEVMEKVGFEKGLIRYASYENIDQGKGFSFTNRMKAYTGFLSIIIAVLVTLLFLRDAVGTTILRIPGALFQQTETEISNVYTYKIINKTTQPVANIHMELLEPNSGRVEVVGSVKDIPRQEFAEGSLFVYIPKSDMKSDNENITIAVYADGKEIEIVKTSFLGPKIN